jgi:hypothetical protein
MIVVTQCTATKADRRCAARDMYTSPFAVKMRVAAEGLISTYGGTWFILSAGYGLIASWKIIDPYDKFGKESDPEFRRYRTRAASFLRQIEPRIYFLSSTYAKGLPLAYQPLHKLSFGRRLQWLGRSSPADCFAPEYLREV